jgi:flagellar motor switch protein FliN
MEEPMDGGKRSVQTDAAVAGEMDASGEPDVRPAEFQSLDGSFSGGPKERKIDLLMDISLPVTVELGRASMLIKDIIGLQKGSVIELDRGAGDAVDILINGKKMAEGEVVVVDQHFAVRITGLAESTDRFNTMKE